MFYVFDNVLILQVPSVPRFPHNILLHQQNRVFVYTLWFFIITILLSRNLTIFVLHCITVLRRRMNPNDVVVSQSHTLRPVNLFPENTSPNLLPNIIN